MREENGRDEKERGKGRGGEEKGEGKTPGGNRQQRQGGKEEGTGTRELGTKPPRPDSDGILRPNNLDSNRGTVEAGGEGKAGRVAGIIHGQKR